MSVRVLSRVFRHSQATFGSRLVLLVLADAASDDGITWISQQEIARKALLSVRQVERTVKELSESGEIEMRKAQRGRRRINVYRVTLATEPPMYDELPFVLKEEFTTRQSDGSSESDDPTSEVVTTRQIGRVSPFTDPPIEPSEETTSPQRAKKRDVVFDTVADVCGFAEPYTKKAGATIGRATAEIRAAHEGMEPPALADEVRKRAARYRADHPTWDLTPDALAKWWPKLVTQTGGEKRELKPTPHETSSEWVARVRGKGLTRPSVVRTLQSEWGYTVEEASALIEADSGS